jgi:hypothetical protein
MRKTAPSLSLPPPGFEEQPLSVLGRVGAILRSDPLINGVVACAVTIGFFHGWLKIRLNHPLVTFSFDLTLLLALGLVFTRLKRGVSLLPPGPVGKALLTFYVICGLYFVLPLGPPKLVSLAAARGWCFATLMFCLGYHLTQSVAQVKGYFYVLVLLGLATAFYGMRQSPAEIARMAAEDELFAARYVNVHYVTSQGAQLRVFSTFVSAGAFGATLAYVVVFAAALFSDPKAPKLERWLLLAATIPLVYGILLSGSRTSFVLLACGLLLVGWFHRNIQNLVLVPLLIVLVFRWAAKTSGGASLERFGSLLSLEDIWYRHSIPTSIGLSYMQEHLLGGGLGRSGYSVPFFLKGRIGYSDYVSADGDLGRLMIEMGWVGVIAFGALLWVSLRTAFRQLRTLRDTAVGPIALASATCFGLSVVGFPSGSPFLGIPMGAMTWFFLGTLGKLSDAHQKGTFTLKAPAGQAPEKARRFLYYRPPAAGPNSRPA